MSKHNQSSVGLDFSQLSDDQLVALLRAALQEAVSRSEAVGAAARAAVLDEAEKARIAQEAARAEAQRIREAEERRVREEAAERVRREAEAKARAEAEAKQESLWTKKAYLGRMVRSTLGEGWQLTAWHRDGDRRIYIDGPKGAKVSYFHTGNSYNKPGAIKLDSLEAGPGKRLPELRVICEEAIRLFITARFCCDEAASVEAETGAPPAAFVEARAARLEAEQEARRQHFEDRYGGYPVASIKAQDAPSLVDEHKDGVLVVRSIDDPARAAVVQASVMGSGSSRNPSYVAGWPKTTSEYQAPHAWSADVRSAIPADMLAALDAHLPDMVPLSDNAMQVFGKIVTKTATVKNG